MPPLRAVRPRGRSRAALVLLLAAAFAVSAPAPAATALATVGGQSLTSLDARLLSDMNRARAAAGIPALRVMASLTDSATEWSIVEAGRGAISHSPSWVSRVQRHGCTTWRSLAENVGSVRVPLGYTATQAADFLFNAYRGSAEHWGAIMSRVSTQVGLATVDRLVRDPATGTTRVMSFNTVEFGSGCATRLRRLQTWGLYPERVVPAAGAVRYLDRFEEKDMRPATGDWSSTMSAAMSWPAFTSGNDALRLTITNRSLSASGEEGLAVHQGADLGRARTLSLRIRVSNSAHRSVPITVYSRQQWGGSAANGGRDCLLGRGLVPPVNGWVTLRVPAACRFYADVFSFRVAAAALATLGPDLAARTATFSIYDVAISG